MTDVKYTGTIKGFQVITTIGDPIAVHHTLANDLNTIIKNLNKIYDSNALQDIKIILSEHVSAEGDVHNINIALGNAILEDLYEIWLNSGYIGDILTFKQELFMGIEIATTAEEIFGDSDRHALSVYNLFRCLYAYHTGPIYAHPPILDKMFVGEPVIYAAILAYLNQTDILIEKTPLDDLTETISMKNGTVFLDIAVSATLSSDKYYLQAYDVDEDVWEGYGGVPLSGTWIDGEPLISILRHSSMPSIIIFRMVIDGVVDHIEIPINSEYSNVAIAYDKTNISYSYKNADGAIITNTVIRNTDASAEHTVLSYEVSNVEELKYYMRTVSLEQLKFLLN